ncbi:VWA domain-containing protein [Rugosimonospora acidiphila]|uniref:VWA domain-containing protein n=1 Tax=Rugosimonospora acidiphila TaxID=556531 RepID=A0ABP9S759_9ACTN
MPGHDVTGVLVGFARVLRRAGIEASFERVQAMLAAVDVLGVARPSAAYWAGRLMLCAQPDDLPVYDAAFDAYFGGRVPSPRGGAAGARLRPSLTLGGGTGTGDGAEPDSVVALSASTEEVLRHRDVATLSAAERAEVRRLLALLAPGTAVRPSRRYRPAGGGRIDRARTVRYLLRHGGEAARLARRKRRARPRRLVLLLDVSGSMAQYADALLRFGHAAVRRRPTQTEVFTIGTRLTRVTRALRHRDPDAALAAAGNAIPDWRGGTRLADSLRAFLDRWGQRGTARGAVVVLGSDGWERGDPAALAAQVARLSRLAYRLVWVNPHRGKPGYEPVAGGMAAALPYLDDFVAGHSLASLRELVRVIAAPKR